MPPPPSESGYHETLAATDASLNAPKTPCITFAEGSHLAAQLADALFDSDDAIIIHDFEGRILSWNRGAECMYGYSEAEALALNVTALIPEDLRDAARLMWERLRRGERIGTIETKRLRKRHQVLDVSVVYAVSRDDQGHPLAIVRVDRDITARRQIEQALAESESTLRIFYNSSNFFMGVVELDGDTMVGVHGNDALARLLGVAPERIPHRTTEELGTSPEESRIWIERCRRSQQEQIPVRFESEHRAPSGGIWVSGAVAYLGQSKAGLPRFSFVAEDVTERKLAQESLNITLERLKIAQKAANAGAWEWDMVTGKLTWSEALYELFGLPPTAPAVFETWHALMHPNDRAGVEANMQRAILEGHTTRGEYRILLADGSLRWISAIGRVFYDEARKPLRMLGICVDITERKKTDRALIEKHEQLQSILNAAADAIITIDRQGIITMANPATETMFGYALDELIGQNIRMLMPEPHASEHDNYLKRYLTTGQAHVIGAGRELAALKKDGTVFPMDLTVSQLKPLKLFTGIIRDLTHRKELEREVVEIAALEQQRIGQDLHDDCGQELTALGLLADSLVESLRQNSQEDAALAVKIEQGIRDVLRRIRGISRGLAHRELHAEDLPDALNELTTRLGETSGIRCSFKCSSRLLVTDSVQATHLYHIAQEACTNALRHSRAKKIQIKLGSREESTTLEIRDDGIGISVQAKEGLGMRILRNRAAVIGARLSVKRAKPRGTVVTCVLPLENSRAEKKGRRAAKPHSDRR